MDLASATTCGIVEVMPDLDPTPISPDEIDRLVGAMRSSKTKLGKLLEAVSAQLDRRDVCAAAPFRDESAKSRRGLEQ